MQVYLFLVEIKVKKKKQEMIKAKANIEIRTISKIRLKIRLQRKTLNIRAKKSLFLVKSFWKMEIASKFIVNKVNQCEISMETTIKTKL